MLVFWVCLFITSSSSFNLHPQHIPFVQRHHPNLVEKDKVVDFQKCWGYEKNCQSRYSYHKPPRHCSTKRFEDDFHKRVDFGYVEQQQNEEMSICEGYSNLKCSRYTRYCTAKNLYINFHALQHSSRNDKYREDLFQKGDIGGFCDLNEKLLQQQSEHKSPLQSWYAELQNFTSLNFRPLQNTGHCDVIMNSTVVFMKLDYGGNMFHHFCDFFNLYLSQHVNNSYFDQDIHIVMWDTATSDYFDPFSSSWKVFTKHPVTTLMELKDKRVCIKDVMFPLLPRMRGGLYYNTYVPDTCVGSSLFRAFSQHFLHRMKINQTGPLLVTGQPKVRVTLLQRGNPSKSYVYRQIQNQDELVKSLMNFSEIELKVVEYDWKAMPFEEQLRITHNTDIFIGMHGAGLAHFMFLPDWAVAFELYNCGDKHCYYDLARLRGLKYITWPSDGPAPTPYDQGKHHKYGENPKFWNWEFDPNTFARLVGEAVDMVLDHPHYKKAVKRVFKRSVKVEL